ncbi:MAG TPA: hypothetical protein VHB77_16940 [Planctomycetaceae bacterium]|nr:hypothetical protein [Planctomycetaceae bacterium]
MAHFAQAANPLLSRSTILILSGFLAGIGVAGALEDQLRSWVLATSAVGVCAYFALTVVATRRRQEELTQAPRQTSPIMERRIGRMIQRAAEGEADSDHDPVLKAVMARPS